VQIEISDISGRIIKNITSEANANTLKINIANLPKGLYICRARAQNQSLATQKFIKH
jgi:hypothetical protein